jgi:hypothetical protein
MPEPSTLRQRLLPVECLMSPPFVVIVCMRH